LRALGFTGETIADLLGAGLATAKAERPFAAGKPVDATRVRITDAGRLALA
jgi:hypothetical protein